MTYFFIILFILFILIFPLIKLKWVKHGGRWRAFLLHSPLNNNEKRPLLIVLHGAGGNYYRISKFAKYTRLNRFADKQKFVVIYPVAVRKNWNDSKREGTQDVQNINDVDFIKKLINLCQKKHHIDDKQVFIVGMSNGGAMAYRLSCELADKITAIAAISSFMPSALQENCKPAAAIPLLIMNGTEDPLIPMHGGHLHFRDKILGNILSVQEIIKLWSTINACQEHQQIDIAPVANEDTHAEKVIYQDKNNNTLIEQYIIHGGGHTWSGSKQYLPKALIGKASQAIDASEILCHFMEKIGKQQ